MTTVGFNMQMSYRPHYESCLLIGSAVLHNWMSKSWISCDKYSAQNFHKWEYKQGLSHVSDKTQFTVEAWVTQQLNEWQHIKNQV